jgi:DivIVA domain-containing protein
MNDDRRDPEATVEAAVVDTGYALAERVRAASFRVARRGYDRDEVDRFLAGLADELRSAEVGGAAGDLDPDAVRRELERVGESTAAILRAAEQTARELRGAAKRDAENQVESARTEAEELRSQAEEFAGSTREEAEEETRRVRLEASQRAEEAVREAEARAESIIEDALQRRRLLAARIDQLTERRDAIIAEVGRLADELKAIGDAEVVGGDPEPDLEEDEEAPAPEGPTLLVDPEPDTDEDGELQIQPGVSDEATQEFATYRDAEGESDGDRG